MFSCQLPLKTIAASLSPNSEDSIEYEPEKRLVSQVYP